MNNLCTAKAPGRKVFHVFDGKGDALCGNFSVDLEKLKRSCYTGAVTEKYDLDINESHTCKKCHKLLSKHMASLRNKAIQNQTKESHGKKL